MKCHNKKLEKRFIKCSVDIVITKMYRYLIRNLPKDFNLLIVDMQEEARCILDNDDIVMKTNFIRGLVNGKTREGNIVLTEMCDEEAPIGPPLSELSDLTDRFPTFKKWTENAFRYRGDGRLDEYLLRGIPTVIVGTTAEQCVYETGFGAKAHGFDPIMAIEGITKPKTEETWGRYMERGLTIYISCEGPVPEIIDDCEGLDLSVSTLMSRYSRHYLPNQDFHLLTKSQRDFLLGLSEDPVAIRGVDVLDITLGEGLPRLKMRDFYWYAFSTNAPKGDSHITDRLELHKQITGTNPIRRGSPDRYGRDFQTYSFRLSDGSQVEITYGSNKITV
jgi:hypothetical protein